MARLKPGVTAAQAAAMARPLDQLLSQEFPESHKDLSLAVFPELAARPEPGFGGFMTTALSIFMVLTGLVLLIASANVANLILARANGRRKELATRTAMGASRTRMVRQLLTESVLLAICGGAVGLALARWVASLLMSIHVATDVPIRLFDVQMDWRIFAFSFFVAVVTGVVAGLVPAVQASKTNLADTLKASGRSGDSSAGHSRFRNVLVVTQVPYQCSSLACAGCSCAACVTLPVDGIRADHADGECRSRIVRLSKINEALLPTGSRSCRIYRRCGAPLRFHPMGSKTTMVDIKPGAGQPR